MKAEWILDYDYQTDKTYNRPGCPECNAPIFPDEDGKYVCMSCGEEYAVDESMRKWIEERSGEKIEMRDCKKYELGDGKTVGCGGKGCVETHYVRNNVTMKWRMAWGECTKCGMRFMV